MYWNSAFIRRLDTVRIISCLLMERHESMSTWAGNGS